MMVRGVKKLSFYGPVDLDLFMISKSEAFLYFFQFQTRHNKFIYRLIQYLESLASIHLPKSLYVYFVDDFKYFDIKVYKVS